MVRFLPITSDATLDKSKFKRWTYNPTRSDVGVYAPYEGKVYGVDKNKGLIKIRHFFDKDTYTTKIYNLGDVYKSNGDFVTAGELIGKSGTNPFDLEIVDSGNLEQLLPPFFTGSVNLSPKRVESKDKEIKTKEIDKKEKDVKFLDKEFDKKEKKSKYTPGLKTYEPGSLSLLDVGLVPLHLLGMAGTYLKNRMKKKATEKEDLKEEIDRINKLIK